MITYQVENVLSSRDLRQLQVIQLEILLEVDRICKKHNIGYSMAGGTLLGAIRHKGFIPWDDDVDVFMLRHEYLRFCQACCEDLDGTRFYFQTHANTASYRWGYGKMRRVGTEYVRKGQENLQYPSGVSIDVFPLDSVPDSNLLRPFYHFACFVTRKLLWSEAGKKSERNPIIRAVYHLLAKVPKETIYRILYDRLVVFSRDFSTEQVRVLTFPNPKFHGHRRSWYTDLHDYEFEGFCFPGPRDYDECLTYKFGDYLRLPPVEQQKGHHEALSYRLIDLALDDLKQYEDNGHGEIDA